MKTREQRKQQQNKRKTSHRQRRTYGFGISSTMPRMRLEIRALSGSRILALLLSSAMIALLIWFAMDTRFFVYEADVQGMALLSATDVYAASGLDMLSIFFVDRAQVAERIREAVPGASAVHVDCQWPARVSIRIQEQGVQFVWHNSSSAFLVDGDGLVLKADDGTHPELLAIHDLDERQLTPGDRVDPVALNTVRALSGLLPEATVFEYSKTKGIHWVDEHGWRIYFGDNRELAKKSATMRALVQRLVSSGASVQFIDLRFVDSPYYR